MEKRAKQMYKIGKVFAIIGLVFAIIGVVGGIIGARNPSQMYSMAPVGTFESETQAYESSIDAILNCLLYIAECIALLVLLGKARGDLENDTKNIGWHIALLVIGAFSFDIFCMLGGIFAILDMNQKYVALSKVDFKDIIDTQATEEKDEK